MVFMNVGTRDTSADHYKVLDVTDETEAKEVKKAFRALSQSFRHKKGVPGRMMVAETLAEVAESLEWQLNAEDGGCIPVLQCVSGHGSSRVTAKLFFLTRVHKRAPAAAVTEKRGNSARALRWIDPETRSTDLDVLVCIGATR